MVSKNIRHKGIIENIEKEKITVRFISFSACSSCHAKGACGASDMQEKIVEVTDTSNAFQVGEHVNVTMSQSLGFKALLYGYIYPFILVLLSLIIYTSMEIKELHAGLYSLTTLIPYYIILYKLKNKLTKVFSFTLTKLGKNSQT